MTSQTTLDTRNPDWGFFGTVSRDEPNGRCADAAWDAAFAAIAKETGCGGQGVRDFLDSRHGRHFADTVLDGWLAAGDMHAGIGQGHRPMAGLDDQPDDEQGDRHPARDALPHRLRYSLRDPCRER